MLPFDKALGDDVVHRGFNEARADSLSLAMTLAVVGNERLIVGNVRLEFFHCSQQFTRRRNFTLHSRGV